MCFWQGGDDVGLEAQAGRKFCGLDTLQAGYSMCAIVSSDVKEGDDYDCECGASTGI